ncbi:MAG TPA: RNA ligase family protein [Burkholderiales bacterium]|nr:RNA ligase family protein [Burkholderiales bacterium]
MTPADKHCHEGQARICTEKPRDKYDRIIVQEKLDGACVAVANIDGTILALGRAGYLATSSPFEQHHLFAQWVADNEARFLEVLRPGERLVGEWIAQAHGTRYALSHEPFVAFDLMREVTRTPYEGFIQRIAERFVTPRVIHTGGPIAIDAVVAHLEPSGHGALDAVEGAVWRVERQGRVDFLAKWVRPDKVDGSYLPEISNREPVWNWHPQVVA